jgi:hypothetical protein
MRVIKRHSCGDTVITLQADSDRPGTDYEVEVEVIDSQAQVSTTFGTYPEAVEAWRYAVSEATGDGDDPIALLKIEPLDPFAAS